MHALKPFGLALRLALTATMATFAAASTAQAADNIRYVSTAGNNSTACTLAAPCRTLQRAINLAPAGGEVRILDSGFYGNIATIRKSLTISGNGYTVVLGAPLTIDRAGVTVALRRLVLDGQRAVTDGIEVNAAAAVHIERCVVRGFTANGILARADGAQVFVLDTTSRDNGSSGLQMLNAPSARLTVDNSRFENNTFGVSVQSGHASIKRSVASGNRQSGVVAIATPVNVVSTIAAHNNSTGFSSVGGATLTIESSAAHANGLDGLFAFTGGVARISNSTFTANGTGIRNNGGVIETNQDNTVRGNTTDVTGTLTPLGAL